MQGTEKVKKKLLQEMFWGIITHICEWKNRLCFLTETHTAYKTQKEHPRVSRPNDKRTGRDYPPPPLECLAVARMWMDRACRTGRGEDVDGLGVSHRAGGNGTRFDRFGKQFAAS